MSTLYLVRHGQASFGGDNYDVLSDLGRRQARALAEHWLALEYRLDAVYSGEMERQRDSALTVVDTLAAAGHTPIEPGLCANFNEYAFQPLLRAHAADAESRAGGQPVDWDRLSRDRKAFHYFLQEALERWTRDELNADGAETWAAFKQRCSEGLEQILAECGRGQTIAIFSSAGAIGAIVQHVLQLNDAQTIRLKLGLYNTGVTTFLYNEREISLSTFNSIAHLETGAQRNLISYR